MYYICAYINCLLFFDTVSYCIVQGDFEPTRQPKLTLNSRQSSCLSLPSARITGIHYYVWLQFFNKC